MQVFEYGIVVYDSYGLSYTQSLEVLGALLKIIFWRHDRNSFYHTAYKPLYIHYESKSNATFSSILIYLGWSNEFWIHSLKWNSIRFGLNFTIRDCININT